MLYGFKVVVTDVLREISEGQIMLLGYTLVGRPINESHNNCLTNVLKFYFRSWFIEDTVKSEGKMYLSTPIDPIFLVLPYLRKVSTFK